MQAYWKSQPDYYSHRLTTQQPLLRMRFSIQPQFVFSPPASRQKSANVSPRRFHCSAGSSVCGRDQRLIIQGRVYLPQTRQSCVGTTAKRHTIKMAHVHFLIRRQNKLGLTVRRQWIGSCVWSAFLTSVSVKLGQNTARHETIAARVENRRNFWQVFKRHSLTVLEFPCCAHIEQYCFKKSIVWT